MNDFVLRGFCKKCDESHRFREDNEYGLCDEGYSCQPVWFLSAKQMEIVFESDKFEEWAGQENYFELCNNAFTLIVKVLEDKPFLVAKILKDAGEKGR